MIASCLNEKHCWILLPPSKTAKGKAKITTFLQGLPGIGPERAHRLIENFHSVQAVFSANGDELTKIKGIGHQIAKKIR